jgi:hypothetical protein
MELRNRTTGLVVTDDQLRFEHPDTSFPDILTAEIIADFGYDQLLEGPQATIIPPYQYSKRDGAVKVKGQWFTKYVAGPTFTDYTDTDGVVHTEAEQYEQYCRAKDANQGESVRIDRNARLAESDWTQLADAPVNTKAWAAYRQELRDVTSQVGFPWNINWPEIPSS